MDMESHVAPCALRLPGAWTVCGCIGGVGGVGGRGGAHGGSVNPG